MVYSQQKKFLFIHIQKTAGTTIRKVLLAATDDAKWLDGHYATHLSASWARMRLGIDHFSDLKTFAFVRNPFDRLVSWWADIKNSEKDLPGEDALPLAHEPNVLRLDVLKNCTSFEDFILYAPSRCSHEIAPWFSRNQLDWLSDRGNNILVKRIGRFENFQEEFLAILRWLNIENSELPYENKVEHKHYRDHYSSRMQKEVTQRFQRDLIYFGYQF
jgi:hypothetical protein